MIRIIVAAALLVALVAQPVQAGAGRSTGSPAAPRHDATTVGHGRATLGASWRAAPTGRVGLASDALLTLVPGVALQGATVKLQVTGDVKATLAQRVTSLPAGPTTLDVKLMVGRKGTGEVVASVSGRTAAGQLLATHEAVFVETAGPVVFSSTTSASAVALQALGAERPEMAPGHYAADVATLEHPGAPQAKVDATLRPDLDPRPSMTTVTGSILYTDTTGAAHPSRAVDVAILDEDGSAGGGTVVACTSTDASGNFSAPVTTYRTAGASGTPRKLYVRAYAASVLPAQTVAPSCGFTLASSTLGAAAGVTGFQVVGPTGATYSFDDLGQAVTANAGTVSLPALQASADPSVSNDNQSAFDIADQYVTGDQYLPQLSTIQQQPHPWSLLQVQFPPQAPSHPGDEYYVNPSTIAIAQGDQYYWDPNLHEFGHYIAWTLGIDASNGGDHGFGGSNSGACLKATPASTTCKDDGETLPWSEGLATFISLMIQRNMSVKALNIPYAGDTVYQDVPHNVTAGLSVTNTTAQAGQAIGVGDDDELSIARALWQTYLSPHFTAGGAQILSAFASAVPRPMTFTAAAPLLDALVGGAKFSDAAPPPDAAQTEPLANDLACILTANAIAPRIDNVTVSADESEPFTYRWTYGGGGAYYPLTNFSIEFWSSDWSTLVLGQSVEGANSFTPTAAQWHDLFSAKDADGDPITALNVVVVGSDDTAPASGPYRSCAVDLQAPPPSAQLPSSGTYGGDLTGQSVGLSGAGTQAVVGSPGTCLGETDGSDGCDPSTVAFWAYQANTGTWKKVTTFTPQQLGIPGCSATCKGAVSIGTNVAMSADGSTAATTVAVDPSFSIGSEYGPWTLEVATFAFVNGAWISTGVASSDDAPSGVIDSGIDTSIGTDQLPIESLALDGTGDELVVNDPYHDNPGSGTKANNDVISTGDLDVFFGAGGGSAPGFTTGTTVADPTTDPHPTVSCASSALPCSSWDERFGDSLAVSADGTTIAASDSAEYDTLDQPDFTVDQVVDVLKAAGSGDGRTWSAPTGSVTGSDVVTDFTRTGGGGLECDGSPCDDFEDFGTATPLDYGPPGSGIALSADGRVLLAGDPGHEDGTGSAYVFTATPAGTAYEQSAELTSSDPAADTFGFAVALSADGQTALIGAPGTEVGTDTQAGEAELFTAGTSGWSDTTEATDYQSPDVGANDEYGSSVALSANGQEGLIGSPGYQLHSPPGAYAGDSYFAPTAAPTSVTLSDTDLATTAVGVQGTTGQQVTLTATVQPSPSKGSVSFSDPDGPIATCQAVPINPATATATCTVTLPAQATVDPSSLLDSPIDYTATFGGGGPFLDSTSPALPVSVVPALSITTTSLPSVQSGDALTSLHLTASGGTGTLTWALSTEGTEDLPAGVGVNPDGSFSGKAPAKGSYDFSVQVADQSPVSQVITQALTLTVTGNRNGDLSVALEPLGDVVYGTTVGPTAIVTDASPQVGNGPPAGDRVVFTADSTSDDDAGGDSDPAPTCTATLSGGTTDPASCAFPKPLGAGDYTITATFQGSSSDGGDATFPTTSGTTTLTVDPAPSTTIIPQLAAIPTGSPAKITVEITNNGGPNASADNDSVSVDATLLGGGSDDASCLADLSQGYGEATGTCNLGSGLKAGTYELSASFSGDDNFLDSSATATLVVLDGTTTTVSVPSPSATYGTDVTYTTKVVTADGAAPAGSVSVKAGATALCTTSTFSGDLAECSSPAAPPGVDAITASFVNGTQFLDSSGGTTLNVTVVTPPAPPGSTSSASDNSGTSTRQVATSLPGISAAGYGTGAITVATYSANPTGAAITAGTGVYYDVAAGVGSTFGSMTIVACNLSGGNGLEWWNGAAWLPFSDQTYETSGPDAGCVDATVDAQASYGGTSPTIQELTGTPIGVVNLASGDFTVKVSPSSQNLGEQSSVAYTVTVGSVGGFDEPVTLGVSDLPPGVTASFSPAKVTPNGTSLLTLTSGAQLTSPGGGFAVTGTYGNLSHSDTSAKISLNFELQPTCYSTITGTVTDAQTGAPLVGATVADDEQDFDTTAADGSYTLKGVRLGPNNGTKDVTVSVTDGNDFYTRSIPSVLVACGTVSAADAALVEVEHANLDGHVFVGQPNPTNPGAPLATTTPLPGAGVSLTAESPDGYPEPFNVASGADGGYAITGVPLFRQDTTNQLSLSVTGPGSDPAAYPLGFWSAQTPVLLSPGATTKQDLVLVPVCTGTLSATVYSQETGQPLAGASVQATGADSTRQVTDAAGMVTFPDTPLGTNDAPATYGFSAVNAAGTGSSVGNPQVTLQGCGDSASVAIYVHVPVANYAAASVSLVDAVTGLPVPGGTVIPSGFQAGPVTEGPVGTFSVPHILVGRDTQTSVPGSFSVQAPGYYGGFASATIYAGNTTDVTIRLTPEQSSTVTGTVTDATTGLPIPGITVEGGGSGATTDAQGHYTISGNGLLGPNNAPASDTIDFSSGSGQYLFGSGKVTAVAGQTETLDAQLVPQCGPATVTGTVYDAANQQPISGASVDEDYSGYTQTDANGNWTLQVAVYDNQPFTAYFTASATGFNPKTEGIELFCGAHITLDFGQNSDEVGTVTGVVTDAGTHAPVAGASVEAGWGAVTTTNAQGQYTFSGVPLGNDNAALSWDVVVDPPTGSPLQPQRKTVVVPGATTTELDFALDDTAPPLPHAADYTVTTPEGVPLTEPTSTGVLSDDTGTGLVVTGFQQYSKQGGEVTVAHDGGYTYTPPNGDLAGGDSFTYTATDAFGRTATGTVTVDVTNATPTTTTTVPPTTTTTVPPTTTTTTVPPPTTTTTLPPSTTTTTVAPATTTTTVPPTTTTVPPSTTTTTVPPTTTTTVPPTTTTTVPPTTTTTVPPTTTTTVPPTTTTTVPPTTTTTVPPTTTTVAPTTTTVAPAGPIVTLVDPAAGPAAGGTTVQITGLDFTGATSVSFGPNVLTVGSGARPASVRAGAASASFVLNSPTSITAVDPAGTGIVDVHVTTPVGTSPTTPDDRYTYVATAPGASVATTTTTTTTVPTSTTTTTVPIASPAAVTPAVTLPSVPGGLAFTGADDALLSVVGLAVIGAGGVLLLVARRRRSEGPRVD